MKSEIHRADGKTWATITREPGLVGRLLGRKPKVTRYVAKGKGTASFDWTFATGEEFHVMSDTPYLLARLAREHDNRIRLFGEDLA